MIEDRARILFQKALAVLRKRGLLSVIKLTFLYLLENGFMHKTFYVYENDFSHIPEFVPKTENYTLKVISKLDEVDELIAQGFDFSPYRKFYRDVPELKQTLAKGAVLFSVFVDKELAHTTWVALSEQAKQDIDTVPYKVDFQDGEVCSGDSETNPKYRRLGIYAYAHSNVFQFLKQEGWSIDRFTIEKSNTASHHTLAKFNSKVCAEGSLTRILLWSFWKEKPVNRGLKVG